MVFKNVVKKMAKESGMTQMEVAVKAGFQTQSGFASTIMRKNLTIDNILRILDVFGYTLAIVKKGEMNLQILKMEEDEDSGEE